MHAELSMGHHYRVVDELEAVAYAEPTRERLCSLLIQAMHLCNRQADALEAYRRTRCALIERFGLEPSSMLQDLHQAVLRQNVPPMPRSGGGPAPAYHLTLR
jgi:DNA-binding SARP family transcriptional activator